MNIDTELRQKLADLPAFPGAVTRLIAALDDEDVSLTELTRHLQHDPVLAARVLSAANRSGLQSGRHGVGDIYVATSLLGLNQVRQIVLSTQVMDFFRHANCSPQFQQHCLAVAICMQELAPEFDVTPDYALVTGLLHDIGAFWFKYFHATEYEQMLTLHERLGGAITAAERAVFGIDHGALGGMMARHWSLPADMADAIAQHHEWIPGKLHRLTAMTCLAEIICNGLDLPYDRANQVTQLPDALLSSLGREWMHELPDLFGRVEARFRHALDVDKPDQ